MTDEHKQSAPKASLEKAVPSLGPPGRAPKSAFAEAQVERPKRTLGLRVVDWLIYSINNAGVFAISVGATYLTHRGDTVGAEGSTWRKVGTALKKRGDWVKKNLMEHFNTNEKRAEEIKMVIFSFLDGTLLWPFVEKLESRRIPMAKWFDDKFGTRPKDELIYQIDPHQNNSSILEGRFATSLIVVPTAIYMEKKKVTAIENGIAHKVTMNDYMFNIPSKKIANWLENHTALPKKFPKLDIPYLSKTAVFELFYTTVCTLSLFGISRAIAKRNKETKEAVATYIERQKQNPTQPADEQQATPDTPQQTPDAHITEGTHLGRAQDAPSKERTA